MIVASGMLFYGSSTHLAIENTVIVQINTLMKCFNAIILPIFHTPLLHKTYIFTKTGFKFK